MRTAKAAVTRAQSTTETIRQMIMAGSIRQGARLQAQMLADRLGVSRTPVNDALAALHKEGLLEYWANRGYSVKRVELDNILCAFDVRLTLEGLACRLIADKGIGHAAAEAIASNLARTEAVLFGPAWGPEEQRDWEALNLEFHNALLAEAANPYLTQGVVIARSLPPVIDRHEQHVAEARLSSNRDRGFNQQAFRDHARIVEAITAGQGARAENMMREHIFTTREKARRMIESILAAPGADD